MQNGVLFSDKPLINPNNDSLHYAPFASKLADSICNMIPPEGLVLGIYGRWGAGKSTLIEFILYYLQNKPESEQPIIIRFNPWWFSGQENLTRHFFDQLYAVFGSQGGKRVRQITRSVKHLSAMLSEVPLPGAKLPKSVADTIPDFQQRNITKVKADLSKLLRKRNERTLVVIDDLDRLNPDEMRQIFALIKSVADFPNVIYLLAFDPDIVEQAMSEILGRGSEGFLAKIIQVQFSLPPASARDLRRLFVDKIKNLIGNLPKRLYEDSWFGAQGYLLQIERFFATPRDIFRLVNTLSVTYNTVKNEVDPADFVAIESLRIFRPKIYNAIRESKGIFTGQYDADQAHSFIANLFNGEPAHVQTLIRSLFPNIGGGAFSYPESPQLRRQLRIGSYEIFDVYFSFAIPSNSISNVEMLSLIELAKIDGNLASYFAESKTDLPRWRVILDRFPDYFQEISPADAILISKELFEIGDELISIDDKENTPPGVFTPLKWVLSHIIVELLKKQPYKSRLEIIEALLRNSQSPFLSMLIVINIGQRHGKHGGSGYLQEADHIIYAQDLPYLENIGVEKIHLILESAASFNDRNLRTALHLWVNLEPERAKSWIENNILTSPALLDFMKEFISPLGDEDYEVSDDLYIYFNLAVLREQVMKFLKENDLSEIQKRVATEFLKATKS